ncbi:MAG: PocR ligand-binding domain-containing protein [Candidatus Omnitrophica bacterium]|nr:PocR ligand-binding domain-containing protein [Candidatus Omnitrophota bacterium]
MGSSDTDGRPQLLALVEAARWQRLQGHFANVLGVGLRTVNPSRELLVEPSWPTPLQDATALHLLQVGEEVERLVSGAEPPRDPLTITTPLGLSYTAVPIRVIPEQMLAYWIIGPAMVGARPTAAELAERAASLNLDAHRLWPLLLTLKPYTFAGFQSVIHLIGEVSDSLVQLAYQAKWLPTVLPTTSRVNQAILAYYVERIFHSLLGAATLATQAEGGSVMAYDQARDGFRISVAQGLPEEIIKSTLVKRGQGIAGLVAQGQRMVIIDEEHADPQVRPRMHRHDLVSSLVAPVVPEASTTPVAVLSLRTANRARPFTRTDLDVVQHLLALTGMALGNVGPIFTRAPSASGS